MILSSPHIHVRSAFRVLFDIFALTIEMVFVAKSMALWGK